jgi:hypothetical protein
MKTRVQDIQELLENVAWQRAIFDRASYLPDYTVLEIHSGDELAFP